MPLEHQHQPIDVATAGRPVEAVVAASAKLIGDGPLRVTVSHDAGCPCTSGATLADCTCEIVGLVGRTIK